MKIPHFLFRLINLAMVTLLRSPLHGIFSSSILAIRYTGIKSERIITVPARYLVRDDDISVVTSEETRWWPNFLEATQTDVLLQGHWVSSRVQASADKPDVAGSLMREIWAKHPMDAAYMNVKMRNGAPDPDDFARALKTAVILTINRHGPE